MASDLENLLEMGFEKERAEMALKKANGGLQGALEWLENNQDKSMEDLKGSESAGTQAKGDSEDEGMPALQPGEVANSLVCNDCGKKFRSQAQAEFHASKTEHVNFSESTEEIAPLTEAEKKEKLEMLRQKLADKRSTVSAQDQEDKKRNEAIRRKATKETQDAKEDLRKKEQIKEAAAKRKEKQDDIAAKERIKAKIKADQEERRLKREKEQAERQGKAPPVAQEPIKASAVASPKPATTYTESRLRLQTPNGTLQKTFPADTTLFEVAAALESEQGFQVQSFSTNFPKKIYNSGVDFGQTLKETGCVPSAVLIVK